MSENDIIDLTVKKTISELKRIGLIRDNKLNSFQKTERILYEYPKLKHITEQYEFDGMIITPKFVNLIDEALKEISDDPYYELIELKYFQKMTHEQIAEIFGVQPAAISKQRTKLINKIRAGIFPDNFILELFSDM